MAPTPDQNRAFDALNARLGDTPTAYLLGLRWGSDYPAIVAAFDALDESEAAAMLVTLRTEAEARERRGRGPLPSTTRRQPREPR